VEVGEPFFDRHGPKAVFLGRWISGLRITAAWLAGSSGMRWPKFLFYNALGGIAWATSVALLVFYLGKSAEHAVHLLGIAGAIGAVLAGVTVYSVARRRRTHATELADELMEEEDQSAASGSVGVKRPR
jgi:membrane-associated protein